MSPNTTLFAGRTALITGSTAGLGVAIARAFAAAGADVIVTGRNAQRGASVVADIGARGGRASFVAADLAAGEGAVRDMVTAAGEVDILVNNAGIWSTPEPTERISEATLLESYRANVIAPFLLTGALAPGMVRRGHGAIVNIGSITGLIGGDKSALYNSTKAAVHSLTKSCAAEYGPVGVRVNAVAPGPIATERAAESADHVAPVLARIPSRRMSTPDEVAAAVLFLASDEAANIHGAVLSVDGGWAAT
ncbi:MAG: glucose 1-dehydrogenase [Mycolicibacterium neoaurum]|uniref:SDR family NAD(P)-dependent oxidoreductase n=1 Tax=Mycolicibacterium neoaurum TaxID=1795 RepID=UPI002FF5EAB2